MSISCCLASWRTKGEITRGAVVFVLVPFGDGAVVFGVELARLRARVRPEEALADVALPISTLPEDTSVVSWGAVLHACSSSQVLCAQAGSLACSAGSI